MASQVWFGTKRVITVRSWEKTLKVGPSVVGRGGAAPVGANIMNRPNRASMLLPGFQDWQAHQTNASINRPMRHTLHVDSNQFKSNTPTTHPPTHTNRSTSSGGSPSPCWRKSSAMSPPSASAWVRACVVACTHKQTNKQTNKAIYDGCAI